MPNKRTPGTRLAESYGMDLDREKRDGRPAEGIGRGKAKTGRRSSMLGRLWPIILLGAIVSVALNWRTLVKTPLADPALAAERISARYTKTADAVKAGGLRDGWLPSFIPADEWDIRVEREGDAHWIMFLASAALISDVERRFTRVSSSDRGSALATNPGVAWWPKALPNEAEWTIYRTGKRFRGGDEYVGCGPHGMVCVWLGPSSRR